jgi:isopentenyldiphosphate isomerase
MNPLTESLDLYNGCGEPLGLTKPRYLVHQDGDWHKSFHCWIVYTDVSGHDTIVFQKRGSQVEHWQNKLDITAAGHYRSGENIEGGVRELQEELGITITIDQLIYAGTRVCIDEFQQGVRDHEFQEVYFLVDDRDLIAYSPQAGEVGGLVAIQIPLLLQLLTNEIEHIVAPGVIVGNDGKTSPLSSPYQRKESILKPQEIVVKPLDFIPSLDRYYHRIAVLAQRLLRGEQYIWI